MTTTIRRQAGLTLVELLISVALGLLLLLGVAALFTQNKQSYRQNEDLARLQEDARFAIEELSRDLSMAGFFAETVDPAAVFVGHNAAVEAAYENAVGANVNCGPAGLGRNWFYDFQAGLLETSVLTADNVANGAAAAAAFVCIDGGEFQAGTDIIGIKRSGGVASGLVDLAAAINNPAPDGAMYFRENGTRAVLFMAPSYPSAAAGADPGRIVPDPYEEWEYSPRVYYVRNFGTTAGDGVPTLCRFRLVNDGTGGTPPRLAEECIAQGVEDLQLEFGLDTDEDGSANVYVAAPTAVDLARLVSIRVYLLMRTVQQDVGYRDDRTYTFSNRPAYVPGDRFHRRLYTTTVMVRNMNNMSQLGF